MTEDESRIVSFLKKAVEDQVGREVIDGASPEEIAAQVDLDVAYSPVLPERATASRADDFCVFTEPVPRPVKVSKDGARYCIIDAETKNWQWIEPERLRVMRARFLLVKNRYYRNLDRLPHSHRQEVLARFFPDGVAVIPFLMDSAKEEEEEKP